MPPEHFVAIRPPLYLDPQCEYVDFEARPLAEAWVADAVAALDEFSRDVPGWAGQSGEEHVVCLRFERGDALVSESALDHDSLPASALPALARFVAAVTSANQESPLWSNDEHHLGDVLAARLAERSRAEVPTFVRFLESNDLDHEVEQHHHIERVVRAHGWCPQTLALWVARLGTCAGQHGHETPWSEYVPSSIADYVNGGAPRRELLVSLLAGNMAWLVHRFRRLELGVDEAVRELSKNRGVFWDDLGEHGLGDLASDIVADAHTRAEQLVRQHASDGSKAGEPLPYWLQLDDR